MKPVATFMLVAVLWGASATAKVVNAPGTDNDRVIQGVAGPTPESNHATAADKTNSTQPSKHDLKKSKVKQKPGLNDPN